MPKEIQHSSDDNAEASLDAIDNALEECAKQIESLQTQIDDVDRHLAELEGNESEEAQEAREALQTHRAELAEQLEQAKRHQAELTEKRQEISARQHEDLDRQIDDMLR
jgi:chromosome segregation ATPase